MMAPLVASLLTLAASPDPRCALPPPSRLDAFIQKAQTPAQRFQALLHACAQEETVALAKTLIGFKTVTVDEVPGSSTPDATAMAAFLNAWATQHALVFRNVGKNDVMEISWGEGRPRLGFLTHGDVVPANPSAWKHPPFEAAVVDGLLLGRGSEDDKGPIAAALVTMAMAQEAGLKPRGRVVTIIGMGEEGAWEGMSGYAKKEPKPTHVISLDAAFPVVFAQFGFVAWGLQAPLGTIRRGPKPVMVDVSAGEFLTQVPGTATLTLDAADNDDGQQLHAALLKRIEELTPTRKDLRATVERNGPRITLTTQGDAVHSSTADDGHNALWDLAAVAAGLPVAPNGISILLNAVATRFDQDHWGKKLGVAYSDEMMGALMVAPTLLHVKDGTVSLGVNMRRPRGMTNAAFKEKLHAAARELGLQEGGEQYVGDPHITDATGPLVTTLMDIYRRQHGPRDARPIAIRGGTYARLFAGAVDFGPSLPKDRYTGHGVDESIPLSTLDTLQSMLAEALVTLAVD